MHPALILCEMILGVLPFAVWREPIPTGGWDTAAPRSLIAAIGPEPRCRGLAGPWSQHLDWCVVHCPAGDCEAICREGAKIACPASTCRPMASASGSNNAVDLPIQSASVERSMSIPSRSKMPLWRYSGRWSAYLLTRTWARRPGPGRPRSIGRDGRTACVKASQPEHAKRGRTMRFTMNRPGPYSSSSVTSSPRRRSPPPQWAQSSSPVVSSTSMRGM